MIVTNGLDISGKDCFGRREDLSFIVRFHWKTPDHLKEAIQVLLAARLASAETAPKPSRRRSVVLDDLEFEQIRMQIASNPNTPPAVLAYLAKNATPTVLERIAENPRTPIELLSELASSPIAGVRAAVGENSATPLTVLEQLLTDSDADVRYRLAENPQMPLELLKRLSEDMNPYVASRAASTAARLRSGRILRGEFGDRSHSGEHVSFR